MGISLEDFISPKVLDSPGVHLVSYYCSQEHLLLKGAIFIKQGLDLGEKCLFSLAPEQHEYFLRILERCGVDVAEVMAKGQVEALDFSSLYRLHQVGGVKALTNELRLMWVASVDEGFTGVRSIVDARYGAMQVAEDQYMQMEKDVDQILTKVPLVKLCLYDIEDLLDQDDETSSQMITRTMGCHKYILNENKIMRSEHFAQPEAKGDELHGRGNERVGGAD